MEPLKRAANGLNPLFGAFSAATSYAKSAAQARISIISGRIVNREGLDGGERKIRTRGTTKASSVPKHARKWLCSEGESANSYTPHAGM